LDVLNPKGGILATNDDAFGKDSALVFTPPADGDYILRIRDLNSKGGDTAVYFIEADWAKPDFAFRCDPDKAMIGPGSSTAWYVQVERVNGFAGPVKVEVRGLPKGVSVSPLVIPPSMNQGLLVLTAAADAPRDAGNVQIVGTATIKMPDGKGETLVRLATPNEEIYFPGGGRGRFDVAMQTIAVTDPSDILKVDANPKAISLKPGEEARIDVTIQRRADYTKGVSLDASPLGKHIRQSVATRGDHCGRKEQDPAGHRQSRTHRSQGRCQCRPHRQRAHQHAGPCLHKFRGEDQLFQPADHAEHKTKVIVIR
jgi:hypothetical protein